MIQLILIVILDLICITIVLFLAIYTYYTARYIIKNQAPFVPVRSAVLQDIVRALSLQPDSVLYDLGCGDGRVLHAASALHPSIRAIGVDINLIATIAAKMRTRKQAVQIRREDFNSTDLHDATHIFCYLLPPVLASLEPKIIRECRPGTTIVTCDFQFSTLTLRSRLSLAAKAYQTCTALYIYTV